MIDIGLEYLDLSRETDTLPGGESQRIKMVKLLGSSLVDVLDCQQSLTSVYVRNESCMVV